MGKMKFKLNGSGVRQLLKSREMQAVLASKATEIKARAGEGYDQDTYVGKTRVNVMVYADSSKAKRDNMNNNTLLKAVR